MFLITMALNLRKKIMKKAIILTLVFVLTFAMSGVTAIAETEGGYGGDEEVIAGFDRSEGGSVPPVIKAKWEMNNFEGTNSIGEMLAGIASTYPLDDDLVADNAQFMPPGAWGDYKDIYVCAIATDDEGVDDISAVYADLFYPEHIALGPGHEDYGCGEQHGLEIQLEELPLEVGYPLFCENIRTNHPLLVGFNEGYNYDEICGEEGELQKLTARVYCKYTSLKWEDPAGSYLVQAHAVDKAGTDSEPFFNFFEYLPWTSFEVDFDDVYYGDVRQDIHKIVSGDKTFEPGDGLPTVRNTGNTRLNMTVWQDDMGLGQTENGDVWWNVTWDARVSSAADFAIYEPFQEDVVLDRTLELSETEEMDFSILVTKFPLGSGDEGYYSGDMTLGAIYAPFLGCSD